MCVLRVSLCCSLPRSCSSESYQGYQQALSRGPQRGRESLLYMPPRVVALHACVASRCSTCQPSACILALNPKTPTAARFISAPDVSLILWNTPPAGGQLQLCRAPVHHRLPSRRMGAAVTRGDGSGRDSGMAGGCGVQGAPLPAWRPGCLAYHAGCLARRMGVCCVSCVLCSRLAGADMKALECEASVNVSACRCRECERMLISLSLSLTHTLTHTHTHTHTRSVPS